MNTPTLEFVQNLALQAGKILSANYEKELEIKFKSDIDLVTHVDHETERFIISSINQSFTNHKFLAEESGESQNQSEHLWIIDPLDGTVNYAHGVPFFCVSIAYSFQGQVRLGAVYDPMRGELFSAERGLGATLNGNRLQVKNQDSLKKSLLVTGFPYDAWYTETNNFENYEKFGKLSQGVRRLGSAALDLSYVGSGRLDGYWELSIKAWDIAAAGLIAEEAGAKVTNIEGDPNYLKEPLSVVAANPVLHNLIFEKLSRKKS